MIRKLIRAVYAGEKKRQRDEYGHHGQAGPPDLQLDQNTVLADDLAHDSADHHAKYQIADTEGHADDHAGTYHIRIIAKIGGNFGCGKAAGMGGEVMAHNRPEYDKHKHENWAVPCTDPPILEFILSCSWFLLLLAFFRVPE